MYSDSETYHRLGWIPGWVVNTFASVVGPSYLAKMTKVASEYLDWVAANGGGKLTPNYVI